MLRRRGALLNLRASRARGVTEGPVRADTRTKRLVGRLQPGEIAVIDHPDLDRIAAEALVERKVRAVLNASPSSTGRYPNLGPLVLTGADVLLIDDLGPDLFGALREGDVVTLDGGRVLLADELVAEGRLVTAALAQEDLDRSKKEIAGALERFAENTLEYMALEREYLLEAIRLPDVRTELEGKHVLVVVRGYSYKEDLAALRRGYVADFRPVLVGVDGGADALLDLGMKPDLIIGDMDSVSTKALTCGAELVVHAYADGRAPGQERLDTLGLDYRTFQAPGTSEDVALLLAHEKGAELIVAVGTRTSLIELMDKGRKGMASTFLVRLRVGPKLVDAKGVSSLHRGGPTRLQLAGLVLAALLAMLVIVGISQPMQLVVEAITAWLRNVWQQAFG